MKCLSCLQTEHTLTSLKRRNDRLERELSAVRHLADRRLRLYEETREELEVLRVSLMTDEDQLRFHQKQADEPMGFDKYGGSL